MPEMSLHKARLVPGAVDGLRDTLAWAGLDYDEGVGAGGTHGPYIQSERLDLYHDHARRLVSNGDAYECFCTMSELEAIRQESQRKGMGHVYDGRCRHLTEEERMRRKKAGEKHVVRFKAPEQSQPLPPDMIFGEVQLQAHDSEDFVILKSDGFPTYHLASVVDDHSMEISHVLRGEEWLNSLPKHHQLYRAFDWTPPQFGHLPLLVNPDGTKLSKRTGDVRVEHYRKAGYEPEALLNFLALMGWDHHTALESILSAGSGAASASTSSMPTDPDHGGPETAILPPQIRSDNHSLYEVFSVPQLIGAFDLAHVNHRKAAVNLSKLDFLNKMTLRRRAGRLGEDGVMVSLGKKSEEGAAGEEGRKELVERLQKLLKERELFAGCDLVDDVEYVGKVFDAELARTIKLNDIPVTSVFFFLDPKYDTLEADKMLQGLHKASYVVNVEAVFRALTNRLNRGVPLDEDLVWDAIRSTVDKLGLRRKSELILPMRHALTGRLKGPSVPSIMTVLGEERSMERLDAGLAHVRRLSRAETR
ncbi:Glutamate--tRNA ligase mitochondrial [Saitozyma podzolica]|uniref:Glutamate--tRNA ligase mitochondrial n=1 Tax=Saitozyma podzolica TaxID=1890683 RepID=A0A427Y3B9_9TREE|nr:Glutamate--tRNA ligase mitochondrial [Saitozyma podzolica]